MKFIQGDRQCISEQVFTPSTHIQVIQGVESANQLLPSACSSPSYTQPVIDNYNYTAGKTIFPCDDDHFSWSSYLYNGDNRLRDQSPGAYMADWDTDEMHTAPHLPVRFRLST